MYPAKQVVRCFSMSEIWIVVYYPFHVVNGDLLMHVLFQFTVREILQEMEVDFTVHSGTVKPEVPPLVSRSRGRVYRSVHLRE